MPVQRAQRWGAMRALAGGVGMGFLLLAAPLWAGDPIQFSSPGDNTEAPKPNPLDNLLNKPFEALKPGNSLGGVITPLFPLPVAPATSRPSRREQEEQELLRDWVFRTPGSLTRDKTVEEILNVPQYGPDGQLQKPLSAVEQYFQEREQKAKAVAKRFESNAKGEGEAWEGESLRGMDKPQANTSEENLTRSERNLNSLFNPYEKNEGRARLNNRLASEKSSMADLSLADLLYDFGARRKEERERQNRLEEFEQLFGPRPGPGQSPRRSDPINLPGDLTRQEVNPVTSRGLEHYSSAKSRDPLNPFRDLQHPDGGVRRGFDDPLQGTAGRRLPGSVGGPTKPEEIQIKPQPTILPIPRRQF